MLVVFKTSVDKDSQVIEKRLADLNSLNRSANYQAEIRLAKFIADSYQFEELKSLNLDLPESLVKLYKCKIKFNKLHPEFPVLL
jgi:hypothetical protein